MKVIINLLNLFFNQKTSVKEPLLSTAGQHKKKQINPLIMAFKTNSIIVFSLIGLGVNSQLHAQNSLTYTLLSLKETLTNIRDFTVFDKQAYFSSQSTNGKLSSIIQVEKIKGKWVKPKLVSFSGQHHDIEPFLSADGLRLYFSSNRPVNEEDTTIDYDIWYVSRLSLNDGWSQAINLGDTINTQGNEFYPSVSGNNNLYFTANHSDSKGKDDIYFSEFKNGHYQKPISLNNAINTEGDEYNAYIAVDESYIIFGAYKRPDTFGSGCNCNVIMSALNKVKMSAFYIKREWHGQRGIINESSRVRSP
jgi:hypothetical protein